MSQILQNLDAQFYADFNKSIRLVQPYIQIVCISKYKEQSNDVYNDLSGCEKDRQNMINLWKNTYKFKNV